MRETQVVARFHARKYRIRQRLRHCQDGPKAFRFTRQTTLRMITALMLLVLCGMKAYRHSAVGPNHGEYDALPRR
jgi:hypothetical protein